MILKNYHLSILNKDRNEIDYVKDVYKNRVQSEADSFINQEIQPDTIFSQDILYLDRISI